MHCKLSHKPSDFYSPGARFVVGINTIYWKSLQKYNHHCHELSTNVGGLCEICVLTVQNQKVLLLVEFHGLVKWPFNKIGQSQWNCSNIIEVAARQPGQGPSLYLNASESRTWPRACNQFEQSVRCFGIWRWKVLCKCQASFTGALHPGWEAQRARESSAWC